MKDVLGDLKGKLEALEADARKLKNQNLADIIHSAVAKTAQAMAHPDMEMVGNPDYHHPADAPLNSGGNMVFSAGDPGRVLQDQEAARRAVMEPALAGQPAPFPGAVRDPSKLDPNAKHPGDPSFVKPNPDFRDPNAVNLNNDGTAKQAPNTLGATDEHDKSQSATAGQHG